MEKLDFKKHFKQFCNPSADEPEIVEMPPVQYIMVDGRGDPNNSKHFEQAIQVLYSLVYTIKFARKKAHLGPDYSIGPLEGLWWMGDNSSFDSHRRDEWLWTLMLWVPEYITVNDLENAVANLRTKKPELNVDSARLEMLNEGKVAQIMHIGPYSAEEPTIIKLHTFVEDHDYGFRGKHHEIYLGDPRRSQPEKLKTIIRQPITTK